MSKSLNPVGGHPSIVHLKGSMFYFTEDDSSFFWGGGVIKIFVNSFNKCMSSPPMQYI